MMPAALMEKFPDQHLYPDPGRLEEDKFSFFLLKKYLTRFVRMRFKGVILNAHLFKIHNVRY